jgi:hypothetical protein
MKNIVKLYIFLFISLIIFGFSLSANAAFLSCNYHAYRDCVGNAIYWYDSCANRQDLIQDCTVFGQVCQYGQCIIKPIINTYTVHYRINCQGNNLYWYDSLGAISGLYKNCQDSNSCTLDTCSVGKCSNTTKCDGTTCAIDSADYNSFCVPNHCGNARCETNLGETTFNCLSDCKANINELTLSFLGKKDVLTQQWNKTMEVGLNSNAYFLVNVINNSSTEVDNINLSVNIPSEVSSIGNLKVNDISVAGDIVSGINIGSVGVGLSKIITFEGKTQSINAVGTKQATATVSVDSNSQSDTLTLSFNTNQIAAATHTGFSSWLIEFLKHWYLWILVALVLIFLFVVIFRRVSSN